MASTGKYFMVEVTPEIKATAQHAGVYSIGDVLFDIESESKIQIPSGPARLIGATALIRSQGNWQGPSSQIMMLLVVFDYRRVIILHLLLGLVRQLFLQEKNQEILCSIEVQSHVQL